jgi:hypothetical protein
MLCCSLGVFHCTLSEIPIKEHTTAAPLATTMLPWRRHIVH